MTLSHISYRLRIASSIYFQSYKFEEWKVFKRLISVPKYRFLFVAHKYFGNLIHNML